jgi:hypothetical protein
MSPFALELLKFSAVSIVMIAVVAYAVYWTLNDSPISRWLHDSDAVVPSFLSITAFIFGVTVSTLAGFSFEKHETAISNLIIESSAIDGLINTSTVLPPQDQAKIIPAIKDYLNAVVEKEWPAMNQKDAKNREVALPEFMALSKTINQIAYQPNQRASIENQLEAALTIIRHNRQVRQSLAYDTDNYKKWISIPIASILLMISVGIVHLGSLKAMKVSLSITSLCVLTAMVFLFITISPYGMWNPVKPHQLQESLRMLSTVNSNR